MNISKQSGAMLGLTRAWSALQEHALLRPIRDAEDFARIRTLANALADTVGVERWEDEHVSIPSAAPKEVLRHLLEANNLKQKDLNDIASPTLISDILAGRREISKRLAKSLAARFHVDIAAFI